MKCSLNSATPNDRHPVPLLEFVVTTILINPSEVPKIVLQKEEEKPVERNLKSTAKQKNAK